MNAPKIGWRYRHLKRGTVYAVRGLLNEFVYDKRDGDEGFLVVSVDPDEYGEGPAIDLVVNLDQVTYPQMILVRLPITFQISKPHEAHSTEFVIYQCEEDGRLWARPTDEFTDGRFERIKE